MTEFTTSVSRIEILSEKRDQALKQRNETYNETTGEYGQEEDNIVDALGKTIRSLIIEDFSDLPFDFMIIELTKLGEAPSMIYDDNGHFAISGNGYQDVSFAEEPEDLKVCTFIRADEWKSTPREALKHYLISE